MKFELFDLYKELLEIRLTMDFDSPKAKQKLTNLLKEIEKHLRGIK